MIARIGEVSVCTPARRIPETESFPYSSRERLLSQTDHPRNPTFL